MTKKTKQKREESVEAEVLIRQLLALRHVHYVWQMFLLTALMFKCM